MEETTIMEALQHSYIDYLIYLLVGFGGVVVHSLIKLKQMSKDYQKANLSLSFEDYIKKDKYGIILSFLVVFLWLALFGEAAQKYPLILAFTRFSFFAMGALGSYGVQALMSRAKEELRQKIDEKTNILDDLTSNMNKTVFWGIPTSSFSHLVAEINGVAVQGQVTVSGLPAYNSSFSIGLDTTNVNVLMHDGNNPVTLKLSNGQTFYFSSSVVADFIGNRPVRK